MRIRPVATAAALLLCAAGAGAGEGLKGILAEARDKARASEHAAAAALYGDAFALAHRNGDLVAEQEAWVAFREFLSKLPSPPMRGGQEVSTVVPGEREVRLIVLGKLDPARCGAFVSAPAVAGEVLLDAVQRGDGRGVPEAAAALGPHAGLPKSGVGVKTLGVLAKAMAGATTGEESAAKALGDVLETSVRNDWADLAMAAGIELAALHVKKGDLARAREAVSAVAARVTPKTETRFVSWCREAVDSRLREAPAEVRKPFDEVIAALYGGGAAGGRGGAGGAGGAGGSSSAEPLSPLGLALKKAPKGKALATVARTTEGFEFRVSWDAKFRAIHQRQDGVKHLDEGGLTLSFADWAVGVAMVDPIGTAGQPGEGGQPQALSAFYRLAAGETWSLTKDGVVQITGGK